MLKLSRRALLTALALTPFARTKTGAQTSATSPGGRRLNPAAWKDHYSRTGERLHVFCDGVDVTFDGLEAQEGEAARELDFSRWPKVLDQVVTDQVLERETILGRGWVRRHVRVGGQRTPMKEILFGRVEFVAGGPIVVP